MIEAKNICFNFMLATRYTLDIFAIMANTPENVFYGWDIFTPNLFAVRGNPEALALRWRLTVLSLRVKGHLTFTFDFQQNFKR